MRRAPDRRDLLAIIMAVPVVVFGLGFLLPWANVQYTDPPHDMCPLGQFNNLQWTEHRNVFDRTNILWQSDDRVIFALIVGAAACILVGTLGLLLSIRARGRGRLRTALWPFAIFVSGVWEVGALVGWLGLRYDSAVCEARAAVSLLPAYFIEVVMATVVTGIAGLLVFRPAGWLVASETEK